MRTWKPGDRALIEVIVLNASTESDPRPAWVVLQALHNCRAYGTFTPAALHTLPLPYGIDGQRVKEFEDLENRALRIGYETEEAECMEAVISCAAAAMVHCRSFQPLRDALANLEQLRERKRFADLAIGADTMEGP